MDDQAGVGLAVAHVGGDLVEVDDLVLECLASLAEAELEGEEGGQAQAPVGDDTRDLRDPEQSEPHPRAVHQ